MCGVGLIIIATGIWAALGTRERAQAEPKSELPLKEAFSAVADAAPTEKASLLSSSISVAMNTTAFGLISAIPLLLLHAVLQTKTTEIVDSFEMASVKVLNVLADDARQLRAV